MTAVLPCAVSLSGNLQGRRPCGSRKVRKVSYVTRALSTDLTSIRSFAQREVFGYGVGIGVGVCVPGIDNTTSTVLGRMDSTSTLPTNTSHLGVS